MKKLTLSLLSLLSIFILSSHKLDEGMFPLSQIKNVDLAKAGLKIKPIELYNPDGISIMDAIVRVGGCTGSFLSDDGLLITNHHCAFGFVQAISSTKNNYIRDGFLANNRSEEAQAKGLVCKITASYEDVSSKVLQGTQNTDDPIERLKIIGKNIKTITDEENKTHKELQCEISEMFTGRNYVLFRYKLLKDVRLVYVPARSVGEYGGELDNWVWPRHSGDFAFLRAYVAPDGSAADFSMNNVPYKPAKKLRVNPKGVKENDFVFVLGYPGRTYRHQPAAFYKYHEDNMLKYVSDLYNWQINWMENKSKGNEELEIKFSGRIKSLANTAKNFEGKLQGFRRAGITENKYRDEDEMQKYILADTKLKGLYGKVIPRINELYSDILKYAQRNLWYDYIYSVAPMLSTAATIDNYGREYLKLTNEEAKKSFKEKNLSRLKNAFYAQKSKYNIEFEKAALKKMIVDGRKFNADNKIEVLDHFSKATEDEKLNLMIDALYKNSIFLNSDKTEEILNGDWDKLFKVKDALYKFASSLNNEINKYDESDKIRDGELNILMAKYVDAKSEWKKKQFIPDANSTLRFTYGYIKGYHPNDGEWNKPFTTLRGVIEKEDGKEYELLSAIKELYAQRDFGSLMHPDLGDLPVDFLYNLDTTGGNSGSPVMDENGDLVGVNFDRAYTATINDYAWNEAYSRSVAVDIRYVLWIVQKVAKAQHIIDELGVKI